VDVPGVNFINIFWDRFLYESELSSVSLITFGFEIFWCQNIGKKVPSKMLMKLTHGDKERFIKGKKRGTERGMEKQRN
jgi:hypothetical protein